MKYLIEQKGSFVLSPCLACATPVLNQVQEKKINGRSVIVYINIQGSALFH